MNNINTEQHQSPVPVFISYPHHDHEVRDELCAHLGWLRNANRIRLFDDHEIQAGEDWDARIKAELEQAKIIILVVTAEFMRSEYCTKIELRRALERQVEQSTRIIPIIAEACDWQAMPILATAALPKDRRNRLKPLNKWRGDRDVAFAQIAKQIRTYLDLPKPDRPTFRNSFEQIRDRIKSDRSSAFDVFVISAHNLDEIYHVDGLTPDNETDIDSPVYSPGGSGANSAYALAKLGMRLAVTGIIADDPNGSKLKKDLQKVGINVDIMVDVPCHGRNRTGKTLVFVDNIGRRSIYVDQGVNANFSESLSEDNKLDIIDYISKSRILHISSFVSHPEKLLCESLVEGMPAESLMSFTPGSLYAKLGLVSISRLLRRANLVFLYEKQFAMLMEAAGIAQGRELNDRITAFFRWRAAGGHNEPVLLSIKRAGAPGFPRATPRYLTLAYGKEDLEMLVFPEVGFRIPNSRRRASASGLGAGDALAAGVIYGILHGEDVQGVANMGYLVADFASNLIDARSGLPDQETLRAALKHTSA